MPQVDPFLVRQFAANCGSLFIGAGVSTGAGLPAWPELITPLLKDIPECPKSASLLDIAQYYENQLERHALTEEIRRQLQAWTAEPTPVHEALVDMPNVRRIFTTNLDDLLEKAAQRKKKPYKVVTNRSAVRLTPDQLNIIKLHGDVDDDQSYVITARDYESYLTVYRQMVELIRAEFQQQTVLFVGYSFSDIDLRMTLGEVRRLVSMPAPQFILYPNPPRAVERDLQDRGLRVIPIQCERDGASISQAIHAWLDQFAWEVRGGAQCGSRSGGQQLPSRKENLPVTTQSKLFGRQADIGGVLQLLAQSSPVICIQGPAGIGKTRLALEVARHSLASEGGRSPQFDYVVWVSANNPQKKEWFDEVAKAVYAVVAPQQASVGSRDTARELTRLLSVTRVLVIIDNFETVSDPRLVDWASHVPPGSKVLITTREGGLGGLPDVQVWPLSGLDTVDSLELVREHARLMGVLDKLDEQRDSGRKLATSTGGNPQKIKIALGLLTSGLSIGEVTDQLVAQSLTALLTTSWSRLSDDARAVLLSLPFFVGVSSVRYDALQAVSGLSEEQLDEALGELVDAKLVEHNFRTSRFLSHSRTHEVVAQKLQDSPEVVARKRDACSAYLLELVRRHVVRDVPNVKYWNSLVTDNMANIDPEWPCIHQAIRWADEAGNRARLIDFMMLLVHYMNSRFLNEERLEYVNKAILAMETAGRKEDQALLRIDALGWTYLEENQIDAATREIEEGFNLLTKCAASPEKSDLLSLAHAGRARVCAARQDFAVATDEVGGGRLFRTSPWISFRVDMAAGDIAMMQGDFVRALDFYLRAEQHAESYGGEGHGYQIHPRLGLAYVRLNSPSKARQHFARIRSATHIPIARTYGDYGLALVELGERHVEQAQSLAVPVRQKLKGANSGLIFALMNQAYDDLTAS